MKTFTVKPQSDPFNLDPQNLNLQHTKWQQEHNQNRFQLKMTNSHKQGLYNYQDFSMGIKNTNFLGISVYQQQQNDLFLMQQNKKIASIMRMQAISNNKFDEDKTKFLQLVDKPYQINIDSEWSMINRAKLGIQLPFKLIKPVPTQIKQDQPVIANSQLKNLYSIIQ